MVRQHLENLDHEDMIAVDLDAKYQPIAWRIISSGSLNMSIVHPREVYKGALLHNAAALIIAHNHPSGDPAPSREDRELTTRLVAGGKLLGITLLDHIIVGDSRYYSFADEGLL
jgi:DNA repair protein RadC